MSRLKSKQDNTLRRQNRVRTVIRGVSSRPRLSVHISNRHMSAQIIDDAKQVTLVSASTLKEPKSKVTMSEQAAILGDEIAKQAKQKKITEVTFDRGPRLYHGRLKALAEHARKGGLKF